MDFWGLGWSINGLTDCVKFEKLYFSIFRIKWIEFIEILLNFAAKEIFISHIFYLKLRNSFNTSNKDGNDGSMDVLCAGTQNSGGKVNYSVSGNFKHYTFIIKIMYPLLFPGTIISISLWSIV